MSDRVRTHWASRILKAAALLVMVYLAIIVLRTVGWLPPTWFATNSGPETIRGSGYGPVILSICIWAVLFSLVAVMLWRAANKPTAYRELLDYARFVMGFVVIYTGANVFDVRQNPAWNISILIVALLGVVGLSWMIRSVSWLPTPQAPPEKL